MRRASGDFARRIGDYRNEPTGAAMQDAAARPLPDVPDVMGPIAQRADAVAEQIRRMAHAVHSDPRQYFGNAAGHPSVSAMREVRERRKAVT